MLVMGSSLGILLSCTGFVNRLGGRRARLDRALLLSMPPFLALFWWRAGTDLIAAIDEAFAVLRLVFVLVVPLMMWRLAAVARRLPSWRLGWVLGCLCMAIIFVGHDAVVMWTTPALDYQYSLLASMPMVSAFLIAVAHRYIESVRALERSHAQLLAERQRIMRDMHDGVGGQLTSLIMKLRRTHADAELTRQVESSLSDLRLIIDSLDEVTTADLRTALGSFRQRIEPWLRQHAVALDWKMDLPPTGGYGAQETLQLLRILQEACSNVIKHADADRLQIAIGMEPGGSSMLISIVDNGHGFDAQPTASGRGLEIMRQRAQALHGELAIESSASGTALRIRLPPPDAAMEAPAGR
jgi:signal transduction histidine kinase